MNLLDIAGVFVLGTVAVFRNIFEPQFRVVRGTAMVLYRMTFSLIALPTVLWNHYQRLPAVLSFTFEDILRNIDQLRYHLTSRVAAEKERQADEVVEQYVFIMHCARLLRKSYYNALVTFGMFLNAVKILYCFFRVTVFTLPRFFEIKP
ncbi:hypothetical protein TNIN_111961 [Trichonephila inaurata madagascariensis]|uniref:Uncharacterized protein n=1 Tax=Trichonephila inaurata madagascariensis TaxID=2747483 RepID=A0A8X6X3T0_9ARAC|nr:hypothetical protein TNIN_111961 [Trichonephila inaurata madagascariensis]